MSQIHIVKIVKLKNLSIKELEAFFIFNDLSDMKGKEFAVYKESETEYRIRRKHYGLSTFPKELFDIVGEKKSNSCLHNTPIKEKIVYDCIIRRKIR
jgi:hypothetical protein